MAFVIVLSDEAVDDYRRLKAFDRAVVRDAMETHLLRAPTHIGRSRIKRLRGFNRPQYRMRVGKIRVYYDVDRNRVAVFAIIAKSEQDR
jgi:mRNA interferase RelE/StbE